MNIYNIINLTRPIIGLQENPIDIEEINNGCLKCKICGGTSGTLKIITHIFYKNHDTDEYIKCIYNNNNLYSKPWIIDNINYNCYNKEPIIYKNTNCILQREYIIYNNNNSKYIIASFGASSCIILCLRNRITNLTFLCHIDSMTVDYIKHFTPFIPNETDLYIIGGNNTTINMIHTLLNIILLMNFKITYAHLNDFNSNSFAINCKNGIFYIDSEINVNYLNNTPITNSRINRLMILDKYKSELINII